MADLETKAIITVENPTPVAFLNVFEPGDEWVKVNNCMDDCPEENRAKCCGNCYWLEKGGVCHWHTGHLKNHSTKPFWCIVHPLPDDMKTRCPLKYKCTKGTLKGYFRYVKDPKGVLREET